jgi:hypothetical protein
MLVNTNTSSLTPKYLIANLDTGISTSFFIDAIGSYSTPFVAQVPETITLVNGSSFEVPAGSLLVVRTRALNNGSTVAGIAGCTPDGNIFIGEETFPVIINDYPPCSIPGQNKILLFDKTAGYWIITPNSAVYKTLVTGPSDSALSFDWAPGTARTKVKIELSLFKDGLWSRRYLTRAIDSLL